MHGDPPQLTSNNNGVENIFTIDFINFVNLCLMKDEAVRPKYTKLLEHPFIVTRYSIVPFTCYNEFNFSVRMSNWIWQGMLLPSLTGS